MKNPYIIPSIIIAAAILGGFWMLKEPSESKTNTYVSIHEAVKKNDINAVKKLLSEGIDVNVIDDINTPLDVALRREKVQRQIGSDESFKDMINILRDSGGKTYREIRPSFRPRPPLPGSSRY